MNYVAYIGFVDAHSDSYGCHDHIHFVHQDFVLVGPAGGSIEACMVRQCFDPVHHQGVGQFFNFFAAQAVNNTRLAGMPLDIFNNVFGCIFRFGPDFIIKVRPVEGCFEYRGIHHIEILLYVLLNLRCCGCS